MRRWNLIALVLVAGALLFTAKPAQAQVWIRPAAPVVIVPAPIVVRPAPVWVGPSRRGRPYWAVRRYYRPFRRGGRYVSAWAPQGRTVAVGRRW